MKNLLFIIISLVSLSCNIERKITRRIIKHEKKLDEVASYFINKYNQETVLKNSEIGDPKVARFLRNKMGTPFVHIVFDNTRYFIDTDSVILFTRTGLPIFGYEHDVVIDFKKIPRNNISGPFEVLKKIRERKFYGKAPMPVF